MSYDGFPDPNTNVKFHLFLLGVAWLNVEYGFGMLSIPLVAWVIARWIIMYISHVKKHAEERAVGHWNGRHFSIDGRQVRIHWDETNIWLVAKDIFQVLQHFPDNIERKKVRARVGEDNFRLLPEIGEECFSEPGVFKYLASLREEETRRLRRWLEREVLPNIKRNRENGADNFIRYQLKE